MLFVLIKETAIQNVSSYSTARKKEVEKGDTVWKKPIEGHFNRLKKFLLYFYDTSISVKKKNQLKFGLFMQSKCFYRTSSFYKKKIDTAGD